MGLQFRGVVQAQDIHLTVISIWMVFKAVRLQEITNGVSVVRKGKNPRIEFGSQPTLRVRKVRRN